MPRLRAMPALLFVIAVSALVGGIFGRDALATDDRVLEYQKTFSAALGARPACARQRHYTQKSLLTQYFIC